MNERIEKLIDRAEHYANQQAGSDWEVNIPYDEKVFRQKFAELIVRECVKVMYDNAIERKVPPDINQTPTHYAVAVLEHFGVEL